MHARQQTMESFIQNESPLAEILEGSGLHVEDCDSTSQFASPPPDSGSVDFAPRGPPRGYSRLRQKFEKRRKNRIIVEMNQFTNLQRRCKQFIASKMVPDSSVLLERFRYVLIASQLLNNQSTAQCFSPRVSLPHGIKREELSEWNEPSHTPRGAAIVATATFVFAWSLHWARSPRNNKSVWQRAALCAFILIVTVAISYAAFVWQRRTSLQKRVIGEASIFTTKSQEMDTTTAGAVSLIQEVELVSRGYKISSPLPPISRMEGQDQPKRCEKLRRILRKSLEKLLTPYAEAYKALRKYANDSDLDRYNDLYDISKTDVLDIEALSYGTAEDFDDPESLRALKLLLQRLDVTRKLFLCCLLSIPFSNNKSSLSVWTRITDTLHDLSITSSSIVADLELILSDDTEFSSPTATPSKTPLTPGRESLKSQSRQFSLLSRSTRELQAKLYLIQEACDGVLAIPSDDADSTESKIKLLEQYDTAGADLKALFEQWESGRAALSSALERDGGNRTNRASLASSSLAPGLSRSTTPTSDARYDTADGSPDEALRRLNGEPLTPTGPEDSDDEIFEAVSLPLQRPRSSLTREERIRLMKEDRIKQAERRASAEVTKNMLRELEMVIKLHPDPKGLRAKQRRVTSM